MIVYIIGICSCSAYDYDSVCHLIELFLRMKWKCTVCKIVDVNAFQFIENGTDIGDDVDARIFIWWNTKTWRSKSRIYCGIKVSYILYVCILTYFVYLKKTYLCRRQFTFTQKSGFNLMMKNDSRVDGKLVCCILYILFTIFCLCFTCVCFTQKV